MAIASQKNSPISRLFLNDVGPLITADSLRRIGEYVGKAPHFADYAAAEQYIRIVSAPFGSLSDEQWRHLTESSIRQEADGKWTMVYDPAIGNPSGRPRSRIRTSISGRSTMRSAARRW